MRVRENRKMEPQAIKLLGRNVEMASSWKVKNTNGKSEYERSNRLFDFNLSRQSRANFMVWEVFLKVGIIYCGSMFRRLSGLS